MIIESLFLNVFLIIIIRFKSISCSFFKIRCFIFHEVFVYKLKEREWRRVNIPFLCHLHREVSCSALQFCSNSCFGYVSGIFLSSIYLWMLCTYIYSCHPITHLPSASFFQCGYSFITEIVQTC